MQCSLGSRGECVSQQQLADASKASQTYFSGRSYCPASDATCQRCAAQWRKDWSSTPLSVAENAICIGDSGCLCLAACELPGWEARVLALALAECDGSERESRSNDSTTSDSASDFPKAARFLLGGAACLALVLLFALISLWLAKFVRKVDGSALRARRSRFRLPVRLPSGPQLQLEGWTAMREKLVQDSAASVPSLAPPSLAVSVPATDTIESSQVGDERWLSVRW